MKPEFALRPQYHRGDFQQYHPGLSFSLSFFWKPDNKNDVGKAIKLCIYFFIFSWHGIIPYREPDRRVRNERIAGSKDLSLSPYPRLGGRYNCSQQNTPPFFITYQANYHQCEGERSAVCRVCGGWGGVGRVEWGRGGKKHVLR